MIVLDTHVWVWWVHGDSRLSPRQRDMLDARRAEGIGVSIISCWEVAKLVEYGRLSLPEDVADWLDVALAYPGVVLLPLTPEVVVESTRLPKPFHKDPADQLMLRDTLALLRSRGAGRRSEWVSSFPEMLKEPGQRHGLRQR